MIEFLKIHLQSPWKDIQNRHVIGLDDRISVFVLIYYTTVTRSQTVLHRFPVTDEFSGAEGTVVCLRLPLPRLHFP